MSRPTTGGPLTVTTTEETMLATSLPATPGDQDAPAPAAAAATPLVTSDLLVEDVSIDGMCGVY